MPTVRAYEVVALDPGGALALWTDVRRWPTFVEGFGHVLELDAGWPSEGKVVWQSTPGGRGRVTERATAYEPATGDGEGRFVTDVYEEALCGRQAVSFKPAELGTRVDLELDYELARGGPLRRVAEVLFIRRALADAYGRTLRRFATEAAEAAEAADEEALENQ